MKRHAEKVDYCFENNDDRGHDGGHQEYGGTAHRHLDFLPKCRVARIRRRAAPPPGDDETECGRCRARAVPMTMVGLAVRCAWRTRNYLAPPGSNSTPASRVEAAASSAATDRERRQVPSSWAIGFGQRKECSPGVNGTMRVNTRYHCGPARPRSGAEVVRNSKLTENHRATGRRP